MPPASLAGLQSFRLVPEPAPALLLLCGLAVWAARRR
ncbi:MAG: PEP-CTERM sorting domain-containing protein [Verrucomicrobia bacterium]|nr:PEP-CTERM sorting domain-containing protein [Verrucomicrobiota bacterium]